MLDEDEEAAAGGDKADADPDADIPALRAREDLREVGWDDEDEDEDPADSSEAEAGGGGGGGGGAESASAVPPVPLPSAPSWVAVRAFLPRLRAVIAV